MWPHTDPQPATVCLRVSMLFNGVYRGRRVLITGHTGFKGSWMATWLLELGADVAGFSVDVPTSPANFDASGLRDKVRHYEGDIRDRGAFLAAAREFKPSCIFHLAAQSLVRRSYTSPVETFETNAIGTLNVLEALRHVPGIEAAVLITSDKCYRNRDWVWGYRETDTLGGEDPYSSSKGCAELIYHSYYCSFFGRTAGLPATATARAGNVIGGGDWTPDAIVPDCVRSWASGDPVVLRNPHAVRSWLQVLEVLSGYMWLGANLLSGASGANGESFNFGPPSEATYSVERLVSEFGKHWAKASWNVRPMHDAPEAQLLKLSCEKALAQLSWRTVLSFEETLALTAEWYREYLSGSADMFEFSLDQIRRYQRKASQSGLPWARSPEVAWQAV